MTKDPHLKKQKQIRMSDQLRDRFEAALASSGLPADVFIERCLDALEAKRSSRPTNAELVAMVAERLGPDTIKIARGLKVKG